MGLRAVTGAGGGASAKVLAQWTEAIALAPPGYGDDAIQMMPTTAHRGHCRICGEIRDLTREHIPPRSVGNAGQYRSFTFQDWINRGEQSLHLGGGEPGQGGLWGYTLCKSCNDLTGQRYGAEYKAWAIRASKVINDAPSPSERDRLPEQLGLTFGFGTDEDGGVAPGDFIRQVLSLMCTLGWSWDLANRFPVIRRMILDREIAPMPDRMRLHMAFCWGPRSRLIGPQLIADSATGNWAWVMEMTFAPLSLLMVLDANHEAMSGGVDISSFTEIAPMARSKFEVGDPTIVGFSWSPYPWDFCSSAALGVPSPIPPI